MAACADGLTFGPEAQFHNINRKKIEILFMQLYLADLFKLYSFV